MGLRIQNNIAAFNSHRNLQIADKGLSKSLQRLSSGFRINSAADDAAGLAVSMRFRSQIRSLQQASRNTSEANSLLQVAEGATEQITNILQRMKELATQAASSNTGSTDRTNIEAEVTTLEGEIDRIANSTKYAGNSLLDGTFGSLSVSDAGSLTGSNGVTAIDISNASASTTYDIALSTAAGGGVITITSGSNTQTLTAGSLSGVETDTLNFDTFGIKLTVNEALDDGTFEGTGTSLVTSATTASTFQVGYENSTDNRITFSLGDMTASGLTAEISVDTLSNAQSALTAIDNAIDQLAAERAVIGKSQNQLGFSFANLASTIENFSAAESVIRDADMAFETVAFTKNQILLQAGTAMLAQANASPQSVLSLLG